MSKPISIPTHSRRPASLSGSSSSDDDNNSPPLKTPTSPGPRSPNIVNNTNTNAPASPNASTSPILSYFFPSPPKSASAAAPTSPTTVPFGSLGRQYPFGPRSAEPAVLEEDEDAAGGGEPAIVKHARRLSTTGWPPGAPVSRFGSSNANAAPPTAEQQERGAGIFRRLSLGGALANRPQVPARTTSPPNPPMADVPVRSTSPPATKRTPGAGRKTRRSTMAGTSEGRPRRAPSPMGERILKGHFDGFN